MTILELESLDYKSEIKNDFDLGYSDGLKGELKEGRTPLYYDGYKLGFNLRGNK